MRAPNFLHQRVGLDRSAAGPDAPLALDRRVSATHFEHAFDFYKPVSCLYPLVRRSNLVSVSALIWVSLG